MCIDSRMNPYLFQCNKLRDIENNIGEVIVPEFTTEHVNSLDSNYKRYISDVITTMECELEDNKYDKFSIKELETQLELTELFIEHTSYILELHSMVTEYANITEKHKKISMYFNKITPLILKANNNLEEVIDVTTI